MRLLKTIFVVGFFALCGAFFLGTGVAHADNCNLTPADFAEITAIQNNPTLTALDEVKQELAVRKDLVSQTIMCAQADVATLQSSLNAATTTTSDAANLQTALSGKLDDANNFYNLELTKLNGAGISGTESIAKDVLAWREGSYEPLAGEVNNFILWSENQSLFATAENRMQQTEQTVSFLEGASGNTDLQNAFSAAQTSFNAAEAENTQAQNALTQFLPADQSLALIQQSLNSLSETYQQFFALSTIVNNLLSH